MGTSRSRHGRSSLVTKIVVVCVTLVTLVTLAACADSAEGAALDAASDDLGCDESDLRVMSAQAESDGSEVFRIWGCGHEAGYVCRVVRRGKGSSWQCDRTQV